MRISDISVPEIYTDSADFRFFMKWFEIALSRVKYDTENIMDLYDPQRCPSDLLWLLADTVGYKYDSRLCNAFNRLVLLYFMSMIRNKGSKTGVTLAAEVNLAQFSIDKYGRENEIMYDRLEDTSIPVNSAYVTPHTAEGYIDIVYFSTETPIDACTEYVRPLGMYMFEHAGVRFDARTKISVDARLTNSREVGVSIGATHVGHYSREDYASMQHVEDENPMVLDASHRRDKVWYRNMDAENEPTPIIDPGWRALYSLQLCNNEHIVESLIPESSQIFSLGYEPQDISVHIPENYLSREYLNSSEFKQSDDYKRPYNLRYDRVNEEAITQDIYTIDSDRTDSVINPQPKVNPIMSNVGDAIALYTLDAPFNPDIVDLDEATHNDKFTEGDPANDTSEIVNNKGTSIDG